MKTYTKYAVAAFAAFLFSSCAESPFTFDYQGKFARYTATQDGLTVKPNIPPSGVIVIDRESVK